MSGGLPESLDAARLAPSQTQLSGQIELKRLRRLAEVLVSPAGAVEVVLACGRSADGRLTLRGEAKARLELVCQRCLEAFILPVRAELAVALVENEAEASSVAPPFEPLVLVEGSVPLHALVEDELLLAIPFAPMHGDPGDCGGLIEELSRYGAGSGLQGPQNRPFAELGKLADELNRRRK